MSNTPVPAPEAVVFPDEFRAWMEYLQLADPHAYRLFLDQAEIDLC